MKGRGREVVEGRTGIKEEGELEEYRKEGQEQN